MTNIFKDSRRDLRERAFQTLFALEFGGEALDQAILLTLTTSQLMKKQKLIYHLFYLV